MNATNNKYSILSLLKNIHKRMWTDCGKQTENIETQEEGLIKSL